MKRRTGRDAIVRLNQIIETSGVSAAQLSRAADVSPDLLRRIRAGQRSLTEWTEQRLVQASARLAASRETVGQDEVSAWRMAVAFVVQLENAAAASGVALAAPLRDKVSEAWLARMEAYRRTVTARDVLEAVARERHTGNPEWMVIAHVRRFALYICASYLNFHQARLGRIAGMGRSAVHYACHEIEAMRDDPRVDGMFKAIEEAFG